MWIIMIIIISSSSSSWSISCWGLFILVVEKFVDFERVVIKEQE